MRRHPDGNTRMMPNKIKSIKTHLEEPTKANTQEYFEKFGSDGSCKVKETSVPVDIRCHITVPKPKVIIKEVVSEIPDKGSVPLIEEVPVATHNRVVYRDRIEEVETKYTIVQPKFVKRIQEIRKEVPVIIEKIVERCVSIPHIKYIDVFEEVPEIEYQYKLVPRARPVPVDSDGIRAIYYQ